VQTLFRLHGNVVRLDACQNCPWMSGLTMASMTIFSLYKKYKDRWWALPLILPVVLLPVARLATTYT